MLEIIGYTGAFFVGLVLGLLGSGGSILALPIIVFCFGIQPVKATAYSLFIIGFTALIGTFRNFRSKLVDPKTALLFGIPAVVAIIITRTQILPSLPPTIHIGSQ